VYFGTDEDAVNNATTASPEYVGTRTLGSESYDPGKLALDTTYYWRVDEVSGVHPESPWVGSIWSFTTASYGTLDDFEDYGGDDVPIQEQIWFSWHDGLGYGAPGVDPYYAGNGSGAGVGDEDSLSYTEETIVQSGDQSMPYWYNNNKQGYFKYSEAQMALSGGMRNWSDDGVKALSLWFQGYPASTGSFAEAPVGTYTMTGSGTDIWYASDEFHYAYRTLTGVATIQAQVLSVDNTNAWAKAGVMIRETLDAESKFAAVYITPGNGCRFQARTDTGINATSDTSVVTTEQTAITAPYWVRLERDVAGNFNGYYSSNGSTWQPMSWNPQNIQMNSNVYIGLALTSHDAALTCQAVFSNVTMTGSVSPQWMHQDIGILSNDPEPMYVALANSAGQPGVVYHDDPAAAQIDTWTEWHIDLKDFADQGINLADVDSVAIGFGDRNNPQPGGSGKMYFDDIRLYRPRYVPGLGTPLSGDLSGDGVVDMDDLEIMAGDWLLEEVTPGDSALGIWIEAESPDTITDPMQILSDVDASGGQYIEVAPGNNDTGNPPADGHVTYVFTVAGGTYKILGRAIAPSGSDDSFWVRIQGATTNTINDVSGWWKWGIVNSQDWFWSPVRSMDDNSQTVEFTMAAGTYTLEMAYREDGTLLDRLLITDDLALDPATLSPLAADLNDDNSVNFEDYALLVDQWLQEQLWPEW